MLSFICGTLARLSAASGANKMEFQLSCLEEKLRDRLKEIRERTPDSIGAMMEYELLRCDSDRGEVVFRCKTLPWMRNIPGTLHGGMCATILDQAMGFVAYCAKSGEGTAPTVQLTVNYHRPIIPGDYILVNVHVLSASKSLMHLRSEAYREENPEKICLSGNSVFFNKA